MCFFNQVHLDSVNLVDMGLILYVEVVDLDSQLIDDFTLIDCALELFDRQLLHLMIKDRQRIFVAGLDYAIHG